MHGCDALGNPDELLSFQFWEAFNHWPASLSGSVTTECCCALLYAGTGMALGLGGLGGSPVMATALDAPLASPLQHIQSVPTLSDLATAYPAPAPAGALRSHMQAAPDHCCSLPMPALQAFWRFSTGSGAQPHWLHLPI